MRNINCYIKRVTRASIIENPKLDAILNTLYRPLLRTITPVVYPTKRGLDEEYQTIRWNDIDIL